MQHRRIILAACIFHGVIWWPVADAYGNDSQVVVGPGGLTMEETLQDDIQAQSASTVTEAPRQGRSQVREDTQYGLESSVTWFFITAFSPPVTTVFGIIDVVILWLIGNVGWRQRQIGIEDRRARLNTPQARAQRSWGILRAVVGLSRLPHQNDFQERWAKFSLARSNRKRGILRSRMNMKGVLTWAAGPLMIVLTLALLAFEAYAFFELGLPGIGLSASVTASLGTLGWALICGVLYQYAMAVLIRPRKLSNDDCSDCESSKRCGRCNGAPKPARTHHCKVCDTCVMKMDHHCPWIHNCVGLHNYHHFCFFLLGLFLCAALFTMTLIGQARDVVLAFIGVGDHEMPLEPLLIVAATIVSVIVLICIGFFGSFHTVLLLSNQTTIEYIQNSSARSQASRSGRAYRSQYDNGPLENLSEVFGRPYLPAALSRIFLGQRFLCSV